MPFHWFSFLSVASNSTVDLTSSCFFGLFVLSVTITYPPNHRLCLNLRWMIFVAFSCVLGTDCRAVPGVIYVLFEKSFAHLPTAPVAVSLSSGIASFLHISSKPFPSSIHEMFFLALSVGISVHGWRVCFLALVDPVLWMLMPKEVVMRITKLVSYWWTDCSALHSLLISSSQKSRIHIEND